MLTSLTIGNIAIISNLNVDFNQGLSVFTGETGAGKSVILSSLKLISGEKADLSLIRTGEDLAFVEAVFQFETPIENWPVVKELGIELSGTDLVIRREIRADGRSKALVNLQSIPQTTLKSIVDTIVEISSQHDQQSFLKLANHVHILDSFCGLTKQREEYSLIYSDYEALQNKLKELTETEEQRNKQKQLLEHAIHEIEILKLSPEDDGQLEDRFKLLSNAEKIGNTLNESYNELYDSEYAIIQKLHKLGQAIHGISNDMAEIKNISKDLEDGLILLESAKDNIKDLSDSLNFDPQEFDIIAEKLTQVKQLKKKYNVSTIQELLDYKIKSESDLEGFENDEKEIEHIKTKLKEHEEKLKEISVALSKERQRGAKALEAKIKDSLSTLGMEKSEFKVDFKYISDQNSFLMISEKGIKIGRLGIDRVEFLLSPNKGEEVKSLMKIASGGELSRLILSFHWVLGEKERVPLLVFDEVDAGIGGEMASTVGDRLKEISKAGQVLVITHSPQIASKAGSHFKVSKIEENERTITTIKELDSEGRLQELVRMIGGDKSNASSVEFARAMLINEGIGVK